MMCRQWQPWVLLEFPNSLLALKVTTALSWEESGDFAWGVIQSQWCGCIYTWEEKESMHKPDR